MKKFADIAGPQAPDVSDRIQAEVDLDRSAAGVQDLRELTKKVSELAALLSNVDDSQPTLSAGGRGASVMRLCLLLRAVETLSEQQMFPTEYSHFVETWLKFTKKDDNPRFTSKLKDSSKGGVTDLDWAALEWCQDVMLRWGEGAAAFAKSADTTPTIEPNGTWMELANALQEQRCYINPKAAAMPAPGKSAPSPRPTVAGFYLQRDQWPSLDVPGARPGSVFSSLELFNALIGKGLWDASTMELIDKVRDALWQLDMGLEK